MKRAIMTAVYAFTAFLVTIGIMMMLVDPTNISEKTMLFVGIILITTGTLFVFSILIMIYIFLQRATTHKLQRLRKRKAP